MKAVGNPTHEPKQNKRPARLDCAGVVIFGVKEGTNNADAVTTGLTSAEAQRRLAEFGENRISSQRRTGALALFVAQFKSPIILILIGAAIVSLFLQDRTDAR